MGVVRPTALRRLSYRQTKTVPVARLGGYVQHMPDETTAYVSYTVPVLVKVDLAQMRVERVVVIDEEVALDRRGGVWQEDPAGLRPAASAVTAAAIEVAEDVHFSWPGWEFGF